ncbi:penicillin-binding protein [Campylobacter sp. faydin G-24]|uniref:Penicillin-binding protein n=1 Tax=Campylobacter anatolicus TaxID=2829105 RepID=A0ABS5HHJ8_9BACT|nr:LPS assembly lipoprotein LptE [Campylobacter anatolicus]MBR8463754.1 penicillin-binding protein [Campylobacter anatolicus]MBR8464786.1 penicillin-binding protein [Campylobacter anatolicus]
MRYFLAIFITIFLIGCGYKPVSKLTQDTMGESIYVDVAISKIEPKNSVLIKDAVKEGMVSRLNRSLSDDKNADTKINVRIDSIDYQATIYDEYGYISSYKVVLNLIYETKFKDGSSSNITVSGEHDFSVARRSKSIRYADSVISDTEKYEAIKEASKEAFDEYIANLAIRGYKNGSNKR